MADGDKREIPRSINLGVRIYGCDQKNPSELRQVKVFKHTTVAHVAKTVTCLFPKSGYRAKDFDIFLVRPPQEDVQLSPIKTLADYEIQNNELIKFRVTSIPITVCVNLYDGEVRQIEVNSASSVADVVEVICQNVGIKHGYELSLAFPNPQSTRSQKSMKVNWLDPTCSLKNQLGSSDEDTLLLRKKFFVRNEDIVEAIGKKGVLLQLLYNQLRQFYTTQRALLTPVQVSLASALLLHVEQGDQCSRDLKVAMKVLPKGLHYNDTVHSQVVEAYQKEKVFLLQECEAKCQFITMFLHPHMSTAFFPVQFLRGGEWYDIVISSKTLSICIEGVTQLKYFGQWQLDQLKKWEATPDKFKFKADEEQVILYTPHGKQIANYLHEILSLIFTRNSQLALPASSPVDVVPTAGPKGPHEGPIKEEVLPIEEQIIHGENEGSETSEQNDTVTTSIPMVQEESYDTIEEEVALPIEERINHGESEGSKTSFDNTEQEAKESDKISLYKTDSSLTTSTPMVREEKYDTIEKKVALPIEEQITHEESEGSETAEQNDTVSSLTTSTPMVQEVSYDTIEEEVAPPIEEHINHGESEGSETSEQNDTVSSLTTSKPMVQEESYDTTEEEVAPPIVEQINHGESEGSKTSFDNTEQESKDSDKISQSEQNDTDSSLTRESSTEQEATSTPMAQEENYDTTEKEVVIPIEEHINLGESEGSETFEQNDSVSSLTTSTPMIQEVSYDTIEEEVAPPIEEHINHGGSEGSETSEQNDTVSSLTTSTPMVQEESYDTIEEEVASPIVKQINCGESEGSKTSFDNTEQESKDSDKISQSEQNDTDSSLTRESSTEQEATSTPMAQEENYDTTEEEVVIPIEEHINHGESEGSETSEQNDSVSSLTTSTPMIQEESYDTIEEEVASPIVEQNNRGESEGSKTSFDNTEQEAKESDKISQSEQNDTDSSLTASIPMVREEKYDTTEENVALPIEEQINLGESEGRQNSTEQEAMSTPMAQEEKYDTTEEELVIPIEEQITHGESEGSETSEQNDTVSSLTTSKPMVQEESYDTTEEEVAPLIVEQINHGESEARENSTEQEATSTPMAQEKNYDTTEEEAAIPIEEQLNLGESEGSETSFDDTEQDARESDKDSLSEHNDAVTSLTTTYTPEGVIQEQLPSPQIAISEDTTEEHFQEPENENHPSALLDDNSYIEAKEKNVFGSQALTNNTLIQKGEEDSPSGDYRDIELYSEAQPSNFQQQDVITTGIVCDMKQTLVQEVPESVKERKSTTTLPPIREHSFSVAKEDQLEPASSDHHLVEVHRKLEVLSSQLQHQEQLLEQVQTFFKDDFHSSKPSTQVNVAAEGKRFILYLLSCIIMLSIFLMSHCLKVNEPTIYPF